MHGVVQAQAVEYAKVQIADEAVFVLEFVAHRGSGPTPFHIIALIFESGAVDVGDRVEWCVKQTARVVDSVHVRAAMTLLLPRQATLPPTRPAYAKFRAP